MTRLHSTPVAEASEHAAKLYAGIKAAVGLIPNAYSNIGSNSPHALEALLNLDGALRKGSLNARDAEAVKLVVSQVSDCDYCLGAHTLLGKKAGLSKEEILAVRQGSSSGDQRLDALAKFARELVTTQGSVSDASLAAVRAGGVSDAQIVDTVLAITSITFTNLFNRINNTSMDFPPAD